MNMSYKFRRNKRYQGLISVGFTDSRHRSFFMKTPGRFFDYYKIMNYPTPTSYTDKQNNTKDFEKHI